MWRAGESCVMLRAGSALAFSRHHSSRIFHCTHVIFYFSRSLCFTMQKQKDEDNAKQENAKPGPCHCSL
jgi:hypothetical protein